MISRAIIRHSNFISPYNRPYEYNTEWAPINIKFWDDFWSRQFNQSLEEFKQMDVDKLIYDTWPWANKVSKYLSLLKTDLT